MLDLPKSVQGDCKVVVVGLILPWITALLLSWLLSCRRPNAKHVVSKLFRLYVDQVVEVGVGKVVATFSRDDHVVGMDFAATVANSSSICQSVLQ